MSKFKAGDLALVIKSKHGENLGKVVELVKFFNQEVHRLQDGANTFNHGGQACWEVKADGLWVTSTFRPDGFFTSCGGIPEAHLMPLRGDFQPEQQKAKEVEA